MKSKSSQDQAVTENRLEKESKQLDRSVSVGRRAEKNKLSLPLLVVSSFFVAVEAFSAPVDLSESFTYQGRFLSSDGSTALTEVLSLQLSIYDPNATCLLYQESQSVDTSQTNGLFAIDVGSVLGDTKRSALFNNSVSLDPGLTMTKIFANSGQILGAGSPNCSAGYTPAAGDGRLLRVTILPAVGSVTTLSPDLGINSVPMAKVAEYAQTLQGFVPGTAANNLVKLDGSGKLPAVDGSQLTNLQVSASNVVGSVATATAASTATTAASAITATNVSGGTVAGNGSGLTNLPAGNLVGALPAISGASLTNLTAANLTGALPAISGASLTNLNASNISSGTLNASYLPASGVASGTYSKLTVDTYGRATAGSSLGASDITTALGFTPVNKAGDTGIGSLTSTGTITAHSLDVNGEIHLGNTSSTCNSTTVGQQRYNSTWNLMEFCNGTTWTSIGPRAWVNFDGTAANCPSNSCTTSTGLNIGSIVRNSSGNYTINLGSGLSFTSTTSYAVEVSGPPQTGEAEGYNITNRTQTSFEVLVKMYGTGNLDQPNISVVIYGN